MMAQKGEPLLQRPLYVFDLPEELLYTLELKTQLEAPPGTVPTNAETYEDGAGARPETPDGTAASSTSCALCNLSFASVQEQRNHVRSDLHGYNLKQKIRGLKVVDEKDFETLVGELDESISGSDSDSEDSSEDDAGTGGGKKKDTTLSALLKKQANLAVPEMEDEFSSRKRKRGAGKPPLLWFSSSKLPSNISLGVYRSLFTPTEQIAGPVAMVRTIQQKQVSAKPPLKEPTAEPAEEGGVPLPRSLQPNNSASGPHYFLCMIGGGHFAAMLVSLTPKITRKGGIEDRAATVIAHKTFHRYTTRRKQGGAQSTNDSAKGAAHSAGSSLRRYNEVALTAEVRDLLNEWKSHIASAELLFIRATGNTNRRTLFGPYDNQVLHQADSRIRSFPFSTRRATQSELMRAFIELTRIKISTIDHAALVEKAAQEAAAEASRIQKTTATKPSVPKPSKADEEALLHTTQLHSLIRRSKAPALLSYLSTNNLSADFTFFPTDSPQNHHSPTPLHLASSLNSPAIITALLQKASADPTVKSAEGKTAFEVAGDRATRDAFRLARHELGETRWKWDDAGVPAPLSPEEFGQRADREKTEQAAKDEVERFRRQAETERLRKEDADNEIGKREGKFGKGKSLSSLVAEKTAEEKRQDEARGMTPEMRARLERERRARAAEARMKK